MAGKSAVRTALSAIFVIAMLGYFAWTQISQRALNGYLDQVRPHLVAGEKVMEDFSAWGGKWEGKDTDTINSEWQGFVDRYEAVAAGIVAAKSDDSSEIQPMKAELDTFGNKRLEWLKVLLVVHKQAGETGPADQATAEALLKESNAALERFVVLKKAYFKKYKLTEK